MLTDPVADAFRATLEGRGAVVTLLEPDLAEVRIEGRQVTVYLDNLRRRVQAGEPLERAVAAFVDIAVSTPLLPDDPAQRRAGLRLLLERREVLDPTRHMHRPISPEVAISLIWTDPAEAAVVFVGPHVLAGWEVSQEEAWQFAAQHMDRLLVETPLEPLQVDGRTVLTIATHSVFKAALITAPSLRPRVEPTLGWPIRALVPCRDFAYLLSAADEDLLGRLGRAVLHEFHQSPYPLSPETFDVADDGIRAIARFGEPT